LIAGVGFCLALGWNAAQAADTDTAPMNGAADNNSASAPATALASAPCCSGCNTPGCLPFLQRPLFPWLHAPGMQQTQEPQLPSMDSSNPDRPITPNLVGSGVNEGGQFGTGGGAYALSDVPLHGDQFSLGSFGSGPGAVPPSSFGNGQAVALQKVGVVAPTIRGFKITEDESPRPMDRVYYDFNYFDRVNESVNQHFGSDVDRINAYRSTLGLEKTFFDRDMSIGFRLPLNTLQVESKFEELNSTDTALGDLSVIFKFAPYRNLQNGNLFSCGLAITTPTGSTNFGGTPIFTGYHSTLMEPFVGYILHYEKWFMEGFSAISVPMDPNDATLLYNDFGVGYTLYRAPKDEDRILTAVVPMLEAHLNDPLNHRGAFVANDPAGTPDVLSFTGAVTCVVQKNIMVGVGLVVPVTGPRPFDWEAQLQLNYVFGAPKR